MNKKRLFFAIAPLFFLVFILIPSLAYGQTCNDYVQSQIGGNGWCDSDCSNLGGIEYSGGNQYCPGELCCGDAAAPTADAADIALCEDLAVATQGYDSSTCRSGSCHGDEMDLGICGNDGAYRCCGYEGVMTNSGAEATTGTTSGSSYLVPECAINDPASCGLCDLVQFIVDATQFLAGGVAAFALLFFIIGGFYWIFSAGNEQRVATGKKIMIGSITGVIIVFLAWIIVNTVILTVSTGGEGFGGQAELFPGPNPTGWFNVECTQYE